MLENIKNIEEKTNKTNGLTLPAKADITGAPLFSPLLSPNGGIYPPTGLPHQGGEKEKNVRRYIIVGERRLSNYWWASVILIGAFGFLLTGLSSYIGISPIGGALKNVLPFLKSQEIPFFPQGLLMCFYGSLGFLLSLYWWLLIFWDVGGGFNEFNKKEGFIRIFRWGYPGKNRKIDLSYELKDIEAIRVQLKPNNLFGVDPERNIYLQLKGKREIPLTGIGQPLTLKEIEKQASELANFMQVSLEGL